MRRIVSVLAAFLLLVSPAYGAGWFPRATETAGADITDLSCSPSNPTARAYYVFDSTDATGRSVLLRVSSCTKISATFFSNIAGAAGTGRVKLWKCPEEAPDGANGLEMGRAAPASGRCKQVTADQDPTDGIQDTGALDGAPGNCCLLDFGARLLFVEITAVATSPEIAVVELEGRLDG